MTRLRPRGCAPDHQEEPLFEYGLATLLRVATDGSCQLRQDIKIHLFREHCLSESVMKPKLRQTTKQQIDMSNTKTTDFMELHNFASMMHRHPKTIRNWIKRGKIDAIKISGSTYVDLASLQRNRINPER